MEVLPAHPEVIRTTLERDLIPEYITFTPSGKHFSPKIITHKGAVYPFTLQKTISLAFQFTGSEITGDL